MNNKSGTRTRSIRLPENNKKASNPDPARDHLSEAELDSFDTIPEIRREHINDCAYCRDLLDCDLHPLQILQLARDASQHARSTAAAANHREAVSAEVEESSLTPILALSGQGDGL